MEKGKSKTITVKVNEENPEPAELIAKAIIDVSDAFDRISKSPLQQRAVVLLIHDLSKVNKRDIELVLHNARLLKKYFIKDLPKT